MHAGASCDHLQAEHGHTIHIYVVSKRLDIRKNHVMNQVADSDVG